VKRRHVLEEVGSWLQLVGAGLLVAVTVRYALIAIEEARARAPSPGDSVAASARKPSAEPPHSVASDSAPPPPVAPPSAPPASGKNVRISLVVDSTAPRAEVFVGGSKVGNAPFVGEVTCRAGGSIKVDVIPGQLAPRSYERACSGATSATA
jgi:hypothetical protein